MNTSQKYTNIPFFYLNCRLYRGKIDYRIFFIFHIVVSQEKPPKKSSLLPLHYDKLDLSSYCCLILIFIVIIHTKPKPINTRIIATLILVIPNICLLLNRKQASSTPKEGWIYRNLKTSNHIVIFKPSLTDFYSNCNF